MEAKSQPTESGHDGCAKLRSNENQASTGDGSPAVDRKSLGDTGNTTSLRTQFDACMQRVIERAMQCDSLRTAKISILSDVGKFHLLDSYLFSNTHRWLTTAIVMDAKSKEALKKAMQGFANPYV